jgi:toxin HigB-1
MSFYILQWAMLKSFRHKGLQRLFEHDDGKKLPPDMLNRIRIILSTLNATSSIEGMDVPTFRLHALKGELKGFYAVSVRANWRIIFRFEGGDASDVDFIDYH